MCFVCVCVLPPMYVYSMQFEYAGGDVVVAKHYHHAGAGLSVLLTIVSVFSLFRGSLR